MHIILYLQCKRHHVACFAGNHFNWKQVTKVSSNVESLQASQTVTLPKLNLPLYSVRISFGDHASSSCVHRHPKWNFLPRKHYYMCLLQQSTISQPTFNQFSGKFACVKSSPTHLWWSVRPSSQLVLRCTASHSLGCVVRNRKHQIQPSLCYREDLLYWKYSLLSWPATEGESGPCRAHLKTSLLLW